VDEALTDERLAAIPREDLLYATSLHVRCQWCGAEPGEDCHIEPDRYRGIAKRKKLHTCRVDPTSDPIGYMGAANPDYPTRPVHYFPGAERCRYAERMRHA
jgi:hypothetical protein